MEIGISAETKKKLLAAVAEKKEFEDFYLKILDSDPDFEAELIHVATVVGNHVFLSKMKKSIRREDRVRMWKYKQSEIELPKKRTKKKAKKKKAAKTLVKKVSKREIEKMVASMKWKKSKEYSPTGVSFKKFMDEAGHPISVLAKGSGSVHCVQGGLPSMGKKR